MTDNRRILDRGGNRIYGCWWLFRFAPSGVTKGGRL